MKRALVLGSCTFQQPGARVGIQFIALGLSQRGWDVDYISQPSSPFDCLSSSRRWRYQKAWSKDPKPFVISDTLREFVPRAPFPMRPLLLRWPFQLNIYRKMAPSFITETEYDLCVNDTSSAFMYGPKVKTPIRILRYNDKIDGFGERISSVLINEFHRQLSAELYKDVWAVTDGLKEHALTLSPNTPAETIPNGVEVSRYVDAAKTSEKEEKSAVFVGTCAEWVDAEIMAQAARELPDWTFHLYGPGFENLEGPNNLQIHGPIPFEKVPKVLAKAKVGLVPFKEVRDLLDDCERPLKFYEYLAANCGVAVTEVGGFRKGMGHWATFGSCAKSYAEAIKEAAEMNDKRDPKKVRTFLAECSWSHRLDQMCQRLQEAGVKL